MNCENAATFGGLTLLGVERFHDERGSFSETFNTAHFERTTGVRGAFVQDNQSTSARGVVRGLHYQVEPKAQGKLVRVIRGAIFDVALDIRRSSDTFGCWHGLAMSADEGSQLWIPPGFAHGFMALTEGVEVLYKTTDFYSPDHQRGIRWDDPEIGVQWPFDDVGDVTVSTKDAEAPLLADAEMFA